MVLILIARALGALSHVAPDRAARLAARVTSRTRRGGDQSQRFGREVARYPLEAAGTTDASPRAGEVVLHALQTPTAGPRVLLIHGWNASAADWLPLATSLAQRGLQVFAADMPGHGAARGDASSLPRFIRALERIEREHGPFEVWIGHSMGATAALTSIARGARARRLVLIGALSRPARALRAFAAGFGLTSKATCAYLQAIERVEAMPLAAVEAEHNAPQVHLPTLVVHDTDDRVVPWSDAESLARLLPAASLVTTRGLGHRRILADAAVVDHVASFASAVAG